MVRVEEASGKLLGREMSGPANIRLSVDQAWESIFTALNKILQANGISLDDKEVQFHAGMGLAGCEIPAATQYFLRHAHPFTTLRVTSDAHTACLGAHGGEDGAIIIAGTGVVGFQMEAGAQTKIGGWGFPYDDKGGGAWMGLEAAKLTFQWLDGRIKYSALAEKVFAHFEEDPLKFLLWASDANATQFATLAPTVLQQSKLGNVEAMQILQRSAKAIDEIGEALLQKQQSDKHKLSCSLVGGVTAYIEPYLSEELRARLRPCVATPDVGAMMLVRAAVSAES
jgi:glucosamine kinase